MFKRVLLSFSVLALIASTTPYACADDDAAMEQALAALDAQLPGKLINNPYKIKWKTEGSDKKDKIIKSEGAPGGSAYSVTVKKTKRNHWDTATRIPMTTSVEKDDVILVSFWARAAKLPKGREAGDITVALQRNVEPYDAIIEERMDLGTEWKLYSVAGKAKRDYSADKTNLNFNLARAKQTIEFSTFYIMSLGPDADPAKYVSN
jgi:hypothetical protein